MAFFIAAGIISNDIVRRETRAGVLANFRLETGAPRGGRLWIDIECWSHLAGTIAHHGATGRHISVSGRLTQKTWRDKTTGDARCRYVVTAADIDHTGAAIVFRGYNEVWLWPRTDLELTETFAAQPCRTPSTAEVQGEAIAFAAD